MFIYENEPYDEFVKDGTVRTKDGVKFHIGMILWQFKSKSEPIEIETEGGRLVRRHSYSCQKKKKCDCTLRLIDRLGNLDYDLPSVENLYSSEKAVIKERINRLKKKIVKLEKKYNL